MLREAVRVPDGRAVLAVQAAQLVGADLGRGRSGQHDAAERPPPADGRDHAQPGPEVAGPRDAAAPDGREDEERVVVRGAHRLPHPPPPLPVVRARSLGAGPQRRAHRLPPSGREHRAQAFGQPLVRLCGDLGEEPGVAG
ncbi:hypothetical protein BJF79_36960 [Actinomadura sp. CNU-125]|nr:hypothetical protein [Actinomadura sp. CNU-125]OLT31492.1 hypothetical protein BJF79_36960 [Actinomadura sp. CNU-125]